MDKHKNIQAFLRIRPFLPFEKDSSDFEANPTTNTISIKPNIQTFKFDKVFLPGTSNAEVFHSNIEPLVQSCLNGFNLTLFAFGQTSAGKTYSMFGERNSVTGIAELVVHEIFKILMRNSGIKFLLKVGFVEIYNEKVYDLFQENLNSNSNSGELRVRERNGIFFVEGAQEYLVRNKEDVLNLLAQGNQNKSMGCSYMHDKSSRSHSLFKIKIAMENLNDGNKIVSELNLIDLAGSEILSPQFGQAQQEETKAINLSLFSLRSVILSLSEKQSYIPYRNSILTKLLQNALGGNSLTVIVGHITPSADSTHFSKKTLKFAQIAKTIVNKTRQNILFFSPPPTLKLKSEEQTNVEEFKINLQKNSYLGKKAKQIHQKTDFKISVSQELITLPKFEAFKTNVHLTYAEDGVDIKDKRVVILLQAHGGSCSGLDWEYLFKPLGNSGYYVVAVDMPGFGKSGGSHFSPRTEKIAEPNGPLDFLESLLKYYTSKSSISKSIIIGYDWGGAIGLYAGTRPSMAKHLGSICCFHPGWNTELNILQKIQVPVQLLWVPMDQFHPFTNGKRINKVIPKSKLIKLNIGHYVREKSKGYYRCIHEQVFSQILLFLKDNNCFDKQIHIKQSPENHNENEEEKVYLEEADYEEEKEGPMVLPKLRRDSSLELSLENLLNLEINDNPNQEEKKKEALVQPIDLSISPAISQLQGTDKIVWAVKKYKELLAAGQIKEYFKAYLTSTSLRTDVIKLFSSLPMIHPGTSIQELKEWQIWKDIPKGHEMLEDFPKFAKGRQVLVKTTVNASIGSGIDGEDYLTYNPSSSDIILTYRAHILDEENDSFIVGVDLPKEEQIKRQCQFEKIKVKKSLIYKHNCPTRYPGNPVIEGILLEDGVKAKYKDLITKAKVLEAALSISDIVSKIDYTKYQNPKENNIKEFWNGEQETLLISCLERLRQVIDIIHLVQEGIHPKRYLAPQVGLLSYFGQGNCHTLASVMAGIIYPISRILGFEVKYRSCYLFKKKRNLIKETLEPVNNQMSKPKLVDDHSFLEVTLYPSLKTYICDPSSNIIGLDIDLQYSRFGRYHPITNLQWNSEQVLPPKHSYNEKIQVPFVQRQFWPRGNPPKHEKYQPIKWETILK